MTVKKYYIKFGGIEYPIHSFSHKKQTSSTIDTTSLRLSRTYDSIFDIGDDVSIGYHDALDAFVVDFNGDVTAKDVNEELALEVESYDGRIFRTDYQTEIHEDKTLEWIVETLITNYTTLTYASTGSTGITISRFVINEETVGDVITRILKDVDWQIRVDNSKNFYFEESGATTSSITLTNGSNAFLQGNWQKNPNRLTNSCTVIGDNAKFNTNETTASAAAAQTVFTMTYKIIGNVRVTVDGTEKIGGETGSIGTFDYTVDKEQKKIIFESGMAGGEAVIVYYEYELPIKITARNEASIASYGTFPKKVTDNTIKTTADARKLAKKIVQVGGSPITSGTMEVSWDETINIGETVPVVDSFNSVNSDFVVVSTEKTYPEGKRKISLGVEEIRYLDLNNDMNDRIKRLEAKQDNTDIVQKYLNFNENLDVVPVTGRVRTRTKNIAGDTMIWGSSDFGIWGTAKWRGTANISFVLGNSKAAILGTSLLGSQASAYVVTSVTNPSSIMNERFNFNTYNDTASTTATWNTAGETSTYTSGQLAQSLAVALNDGTITAATLTATEVSGSFDYVMTADGGSNWESVTSGAAHTFTNTGTDLRWRATENAASTGEINNIKIDYS
jgi:hypothetical protein